MLYLGWVVAAFFGGVLLTAWAMNRQRSLRRRFDAIGATNGMEYADIVAAVRALPSTQIRSQDGQVLRTWQESDYAITLLFDGKDVCRGVMEERI